MANNISAQIQQLNQQMQSHCWAKNYLTATIFTSLPVWALVPVNADELSKLSDEELGKELLAKFDKLYDGKVNIAGGLVVQNWTAKPYVRGSCTLAAPKKYRKQLGKPIGGDDEEGESLVYFVGEHTLLTHHSLVPEAACEGRQAALKVASSLGIDVGTTAQK